MTSSTLPPGMPRAADVFAARARIADRVRRTPLVPSPWLSERTGARVFLKLESLQLTNSFKIRGAYNALLSQWRPAKLGQATFYGFRKTSPVPVSEMSPVPVSGNGKTGSVPISVVTASAGNHGRALACAAEALGIRATIFTPRDAAATKVAAIRRHGADLRSDAADYDEAERLAKQHARDTGAIFVSAYSDPDVIAGAGTIALELVEDLPHVDLVVCPVGGGGLLSGIASTLKQIAPSCAHVGVEAAASPAFHVSLAAGRITTIDPKPTLADGLAGNMDPDTITFDILRQTIDRIELVSEEELADGIRTLAAEEHLIAEGAGVAAVAAVMSGRLDLKGRTVAAIVSGSNLDVAKLARLLR